MRCDNTSRQQFFFDFLPGRSYQRVENAIHWIRHLAALANIYPLDSDWSMRSLGPSIQRLINRGQRDKPQELAFVLLLNKWSYFHFLSGVWQEMLLSHGRFPTLAVYWDFSLGPISKIENFGKNAYPVRKVNKFFLKTGQELTFFFSLKLPTELRLLWFILSISSISKTMYFETVISPVNSQGVDINYFEIPTEINVTFPLKK